MAEQDIADVPPWLLAVSIVACIVFILVLFWY